MFVRYAFVLSLVFLCYSASASSDLPHEVYHACPPLLTLDTDFSKKNNCSSTMYASLAQQIWLHPQNDTRINLMYLLGDKVTQVLEKEMVYANQRNGFLDTELLYTTYRELSDYGELPEQNIWSHAAGYEHDEPNEDDKQNFLKTASLLGLSRVELEKRLKEFHVFSNEERYYANIKCETNHIRTLTFIAEALLKSSMPLSDKKNLFLARLSFYGKCADAQYTKPEGLSQNIIAQEFSDYFDASAAFYRADDTVHIQDYQKATQGFLKLQQAFDPYIQETAWYMYARNFQYCPANNQQGLARTAYQAYLNRYPDGMYTNWASQGIIFMMFEENQKQSDADLYQSFFDFFNVYNFKTIYDPWVYYYLNALDRKIYSQYAGQILEDGQSWKPIRFDSPFLAAIAMLGRMKYYSDNNKKPFTFNELQQHRHVFEQSNALKLFHYLEEALLFFVEKNPNAVLEHASKYHYIFSEQNHTPLDFSLFILRGLSLEKIHAYEQANALWRSVYKHATPSQQQVLQIAIAKNLERMHQINQIFASHEITQPMIRTQLIEHAASFEELNAILNDKNGNKIEKSYAFQTLMHQLIGQHQYQEALHAYQKYAQQPYILVRGLRALLHASSQRNIFKKTLKCHTFDQTLQALVRNQNDLKALACYAQAYEQDAAAYFFIQNPLPNEIGGGLTNPTTTKPRSSVQNLYLMLYQASQASREKHAQDIAAFALSHLLVCYRYQNLEYRCNPESENVSRDTRKQWFQTLKKKYKNTDWAKSMKMYW